MRDIRDSYRNRKRRQERMIERRSQLNSMKRSLEQSMTFFTTQVSDVKPENLDNCPICLSAKANVITQCGHLFCRGCMVKCLKRKHQCPICKNHVSPTDAHEIRLENSPPTMESEENIIKYGSKLSKLIELLKRIPSDEKVVIYVQWATLVKTIHDILVENKIQTCMLHGNMACQNAAIKRFNQTDTNILIGNVDGTGLDLICANHLIFIHALFGENFVVRAMEDQAIARIHRTGQTRKVHVYWFVSRNTLEEQTYLQTRNT